MEVNLLWLVAVALAAARVTRLVVYDDGPAQMFKKIRARAGVEEQAPGVRVCTRGSWSELFNCHWCMGTWVAMPASIVVCGLRPEAIVYWLAIAFVVGLLNDLG